MNLFDLLFCLLVPIVALLFGALLGIVSATYPWFADAVLIIVAVVVPVLFMRWLAGCLTRDDGPGPSDG